MRRVSVRRHVRRRFRREPAVERLDIPSIEMQLKRKSIQRLDDDGRAVITRGQRLATFRDILAKHGAGIEWREHVYSTVDKLLGWNVVPPTTLRITSDGERVVSAQEFIPGAVDFADIQEEIRKGLPPYLFYKEKILERADKRRLMQIALLDAVLGQYDRHGGNIVVDPEGRPWAIDNEAALDREWKLQDVPEGEMLDLFAREPIPPDLLSDLRNLRKGDFYAALAGIEPRFIDAAWSRKQEVIRRGVF